MTELATGGVWRWSIGAAVAAAAVLTLVPSPTHAESTDAEEATPDTYDLIVRTNGEELRGEIVEETAKGFRFYCASCVIPMELSFTYDDPTVRSVHRDLIVEDSAQLQHWRAQEEEKVHPGHTELLEQPEDFAKVYHIKMDGSSSYAGWFRLDFERTRPITKTPMERVFEDVEAVFDDIIVEELPDGRIVKTVDPAVRDKHIVLIEIDLITLGGVDGVFEVEAQLRPIIQDQIDKNRRLVFWVGDTNNGGTILPWISPEIVFKPTGTMYFTSDLDLMIDLAAEELNRGDRVVMEKQVSLRLGHAVGFAIQGGYEEVGPAVINAMTRSKHWLSYRIVGGQPEILTQPPTQPQLRAGFRVLTDNGRLERYNDGRFSSVAPDLLRLDADLADVLGISHTPSQTIQEVMGNLGVGPYHVLEDIRSQEIIDGWKDEIVENADKLNELYRDIEERFFRPIRAESVEEAVARVNRLRSEMINLMRRINRILEEYAEVFDPSEQWREFFRTSIEALEREGDWDADWIARLNELQRALP
ncbi:MAG: 2-hydroxyacyl-CoA dehydratase family protein [Planctomycetota bacterium]